MLQLTAAISAMSLQHTLQLQEAEEEDYGEEAPGPKASEQGNPGATEGQQLQKAEKDFGKKKPSTEASGHGEKKDKDGASRVVPGPGGRGAGHRPTEPAR